MSILWIRSIFSFFQNKKDLYKNKKACAWIEKNVSHRDPIPVLARAGSLLRLDGESLGDRIFLNKGSLKFYDTYSDDRDFIWVILHMEHSSPSIHGGAVAMLTTEFKKWSLVNRRMMMQREEDRYIAKLLYEYCSTEESWLC